jgi:hypothetical protein
LTGEAKRPMSPISAAIVKPVTQPPGSLASRSAARPAAGVGHEFQGRSDARRTHSQRLDVLCLRGVVARPGAVPNDPPATIAEAIERSGLGWPVEREPIAIDRGDVATVDDWWLPRCEEIRGGWANVREDTRQVLGIVGERYRIYVQSRVMCGWGAAPLPLIDQGGELVGAPGPLSTDSWRACQVTTPIVASAYIATASASPAKTSEA